MYHTSSVSREKFLGEKGTEIGTAWGDEADQHAESDSVKELDSAVKKQLIVDLDGIRVSCVPLPTY